MWRRRRSSSRREKFTRDNFEPPTYSAPQHRACAKKPTYLLFGTPGTELRRSKKTETQAGTTANEVLLNVGLTRTRVPTATPEDDRGEKAEPRRNFFDFTSVIQQHAEPNTLPSWKSTFCNSTRTRRALRHPSISRQTYRRDKVGPPNPQANHESCVSFPFRAEITRPELPDPPP